jgi:hypothetical protein
MVMVFSFSFPPSSNQLAPAGPPSFLPLLSLHSDELKLFKIEIIGSD